MSRGSRGGARARPSRPKGAPDLDEFSDEEDYVFSRQKRPQPMFPDIDLPMPKPPSAQELSAVNHYLSLRKRVHSGPYFATLDPSSVADEKTGRTLKRAGFDPFNDQETFASRSHAKKRTAPDLHGEGREYALKFFSPELWSILDPERKNPIWKTAKFDFEVDMLDPDTPPAAKHKSLKRKRHTALSSLTTSADDDDENATMNDADAGQEHEDDSNAEDSDPLISSTRRLTKSSSKKTGKKGRSRTATSSREKRGLDAEDDFTPTKKKKGPSPPQSLHKKKLDKRQKERRKQEMGKTSNEDDEDEDEADKSGSGGESDAHDDDANRSADDGSESDGEPVDSEFEESDEGDADDYNAEKYFDDEEREDDDGDGLGFGGAGGGGGDDGDF